MFKQSLLAIVLGSSFAFADHHEEGPCMKDMQTYCKDAMGDKEKMGQCMKDNADKFSAECKAKKTEMGAMMEKLHTACVEDIKTLCPDVKPGERRIMQCLKKNKKKVSATCKAEVEDMKKEHKAKKQKH